MNNPSSDSISSKRTSDQRTARESVPIVVNNPELTAQLDDLFAKHFGIHRRPTLRVTINHGLKRLLDIVLSTIGLALLWPVLLVSAIATLLDTGRPVTYSQMRRVRFGRMVRIWKMRTLIVGTDRKLGNLVNIKHNGRFLNISKSAADYTRVGRWLERLWIVELPQLWSVLLGQMSLVGNRPIPDYVINALGMTPDVLERFASPQGLTGYVQVIGRDNVTDSERIALECHYSQVFENGNVFLEDLRIIVLTVMAFLSFGKPRTPLDFAPESTVDFDVSQDDNETPGISKADAPLINSLACPTCYVVNASCNIDKCQKQCVASCPNGALRIDHTNGDERHRPFFLDTCVACSQCLSSCPVGAIDKALLTKTDGSFTCKQCATVYLEKNGVIDLLPQVEHLEKSPYFEFYEQDYVNENPNMHMEDTEWKLRELRPLHNQASASRTLLDLGCGAGEIGRRIADDLNISKRMSCDWSSDILSVASQEYPQGCYVRVDAAYLPFTNSAFGIGLLIDVIEHQHKPDQVLRELHRVSRQLLLRAPLEDCLYERLRRKRKDLFHESAGHVIYLNPASAAELLRQQGFVIHQQSVTHIAWSHWRRYIFGNHTLKVRGSSLARVIARMILPKALHRRIFVMNYNALCSSTFAKSTAAIQESSHKPSETDGRV